MTPEQRRRLGGGVLTLTWAGLLLFHAFATILFAGWVGIADGFLPWSLFAAGLWIVTARWRGLGVKPAIRGSLPLLAIWIVLLVAAVWGIDHRANPLPDRVLLGSYIGFPILLTLGITGRTLVDIFRSSARELTAA